MLSRLEIWVYEWYEFINRFEPDRPCDCLNSFLKREKKDQNSIQKQTLRCSLFNIKKSRNGYFWIIHSAYFGENWISHLKLIYLDKSLEKNLTINKIYTFLWYAIVFDGNIHVKYPVYNISSWWWPGIINSVLTRLTRCIICRISCMPKLEPLF